MWLTVSEGGREGYGAEIYRTAVWKQLYLSMSAELWAFLSGLAHFIDGSFSVQMIYQSSL